MMPSCPRCESPVRLADVPQTKDQLMRNVDNYVCEEGHQFEASIPLVVKDGHALRADI